MNGYAGRILRIDLSNRTIKSIPTSDYEHWVGGHGMGSAIFYDILIREKKVDLEKIAKSHVEEGKEKRGSSGDQSHRLAAFESVIRQAGAAGSRTVRGRGSVPGS